MPDKKFILVGRNSFLSQNFSSFLRKKKSNSQVLVTINL